MVETSNPGKSGGVTEENGQPNDQDEHDVPDVIAGSVDGGSGAPLLELLGIRADEHVSVCWQRPGRKFMTQLTTGGDAARVAAEHVDDANVWFGVNPIGEHVRSGRGRAGDVTRCVALWADLDVGKDGACVDADQAVVIVKEISDKLGTNPVALVDSGSGGLHPYWLLDDADPAWRLKLNPEEPLKDIAARERAQKVLRRFQRLVDDVAAGHGVKVDNVSDISRVLRWPGSYNRKSPDQPGLVEMVESPLGASEPLTLEWVEQALDDAGIPTDDPKCKPEDDVKTRVSNAAGDWRFGLITHPYIRKMIEAWRTDEVVGGRHQWMLSCFVRLACAHRCGRIAEKDYKAAIEVVFDRFTLGDLGRELRPDEVTDTLPDAIKKAESKDDGEALGECGGPDRDVEQSDADYGPEDATQQRSDDGASDTSNRLEDGYLGERIYRENLQNYRWTAEFGWMHYDGRRWEPTKDPVVANEVRNALIQLHQAEASAGADHIRLQKISGLLSKSRIEGITGVAKMASASESQWIRFDDHPDLLNVGNGVVDLRTGELGPHDPGLYLTKVVDVDYISGAKHEDWCKALLALPDVDSEAWLQERLGQGITGHPVPDDRLLVLKGGGSNGKTTIVDGVRGALGGDYMVTMPDRILLARNGDHPTEMMKLCGARLAVMEEFPEQHINVKRLKDIQGTGELTARYIGKDSVSWKPSHSAIITTNYFPKIDESDHGTWRRLVMLEFPYTYRKAGASLGPDDRVGEPGLRARIERGAKQQQAVLAWLVDGARRWYANAMAMSADPKRVTEATAQWRDQSDVMLRYITERLVLDPQLWVPTGDLFEDFTYWASDAKHRQWTSQTFTSRFLGHEDVDKAGVSRGQVSTTREGLSRRPSRVSGNPGGAPLPKRTMAMLGVGFRVDVDEEAPEGRDWTGRAKMA